MDTRVFYAAAYAVVGVGMCIALWAFHIDRQMEKRLEALAAEQEYNIKAARFEEETRLNLVSSQEKLTSLINSIENLESTLEASRQSRTRAEAETLRLTKKLAALRRPVRKDDLPPLPGQGSSND